MTPDDDPAHQAAAEPGDAAVHWARGFLDAPAEAELLRARPWSATWLLRTPRRTAFLKATGPASHYEAALMHQLSALAGPDAASFVPDVLASDAGRGWLLMANAGPTQFVRTARRRSRAGPDRDDVPWDGGPWRTLLARFAELQRAAAPHWASLIEAGVPDERPHRLGDVFAGLLSDSPNLAGLTAQERDAAAGLATSWSADLARLASVPIPVSVQHGDLHDNNVSPGADGQPRFFDFGDASIAHPFTTLLMPLRIAATRGATGTDLGRLREAYLTPFTDLAPINDLQHVLDAALRLAWVSRASSWDRALVAAPAGHEWGDPVVEVVRELLSLRSADEPTENS